MRGAHEPERVAVRELSLSGNNLDYNVCPPTRAQLHAEFGELSLNTDARSKSC